MYVFSAHGEEFLVGGTCIMCCYFLVVAGV